MSNVTARAAGQQKIVWITGAASGFGLLTAAVFIGAGWTVVATMRQSEKRRNEVIQRVGDILEKDEIFARGEFDNGDRALDPRLAALHIWELDVTSEEAVKQTAARIADAFGRLDVLVNNAGYASGGFVEHIPMDEWRAQFESNVFGVIHTCRAALPIMRTQGNGCIIQLSSISGRMGFPGMAPYVSSKFALEGFSESLRYEAIVHGVDVVLVEPGSFRTNIWDRGLSGLEGQVNSSAYANYMAKLRASVMLTAKSAGAPMQVAQLILRIASMPNGARKLRYTIGKGVISSLLARQWLPWLSFERIVLRMIGMKVAARTRASDKDGNI